MVFCSGNTNKGLPCKRPGMYEHLNDDGKNLSYCVQHVPKCPECCTICMMPLYDKFITPCNHVFHNRCLQKWCNINKSCPICRLSFTHVRNLPYRGIINKIHHNLVDVSCAVDIALQCDNVDTFVSLLKEILLIDIHNLQQPPD